MNMRPKPEMFPCPGGCGTNGYTRALCVACKDAVAIDDARDFMGHVSRVDRHFAAQSERLEKFIVEQTKDLFVHLTTALAVPPAAPAQSASDDMIAGFEARYPATPGVQELPGDPIGVGGGWHPAFWNKDVETPPIRFDAKHPSGGLFKGRSRTAEPGSDREALDRKAMALGYGAASSTEEAKQEVTALSNKALYAIRVLLLQSIDEAKERMWQAKQEELERTLAEFDAWRKEQ